MSDLILTLPGFSHKVTLKTHQSELHVEQYKGLMDYVRNNTGFEAIGRVTIMPSTFQVIFLFNLIINYIHLHNNIMYGTKLSKFDGNSS